MTSCEEEIKLSELEFGINEQKANKNTGKRIYAVNCFSCHGDISTTNKRNTSATAVKDAIIDVSSMSTLSKMSDFQINSIVLALKDDVNETPPQVTGIDHYNNLCLSCHGDISTTNKRGINLVDLKQAASQVQSMSHLSNIEDDILNSIVLALKNDTQEYPELVKLCQNPTSISKSDSKALTVIQLENTLKSLFGEDIVQNASDELSLLKSITKSDGHNSFSTFNYQVDAISINNILNLMRKVSQPAAQAVMNQTECINSNNIQLKSNLSEECLSEMIDKWTFKILRNEVSSEQKNKYKNTFNEFAGNNLKEITGNLLLVLLMEPDFLFMYENRGIQKEDGNLELTDYEIAHKLSYTLTQGPADDELLNLAKNNLLRVDNNIEKQIDRLIQNKQSSQSNIKNFLKELFGFYKTKTTNTYTADFLSNDITQSQGDLVLPEAQEEADRFFQYVAFSTNGNYSDLLTSRYVDATNLTTVQKLYGISQNTFEIPSRPGILNRSVIHSNGTNWKHPMKIASMIRRNLLCDELPDPPDDFDVEAPGEDEGDGLITARERFERLTSGPACIGCHKVMNGLAFAFDNIDSAGRNITHEKIFDANGNLIGSKAVNTITTPNLYPGYDQEVANGSELAIKVSKTPKAHQCFSKRIIEYLNSRPNQQEDGCNIDSLQEMSVQGSSIKEMVKAHLSNPNFYLKRIKE